MANPNDLDQGGSTTEYSNVAVGPTLGWLRQPVPTSTALSPNFVNLQTLGVLPGNSGAINSANLTTALNGNNGTMFYLPTGVYDVSSVVTIVSGVTQIWGPGTLHYSGPTNGGSAGIFHLTSTSDLQLVNLKFNMPVANTSASALDINDFGGLVQNLYIKNCHFIACGQRGVSAFVVNGGNTIWVQDCFFEQFAASAILLQANAGGSLEQRVVRNKIVGNNSNTYHTLFLSTGGAFIQCNDNWIFGGNNTQIRVEDGGLGSMVCRNSCQGIGDGIHIAVSNTNVNSINVVGNVVDHSATSPNFEIGIGLLGSGANNVQYCNVSDNIVRSVGATGVILEAGFGGGGQTKFNTVSGNSVINATLSASGVAIALSGQGGGGGVVSNNFVHDNTIRSDGVNMTYGIAEIAAGATINTNYIFNNFIFGAQTAHVLIIGGSSQQSGNTLPT